MLVEMLSGTIRRPERPVCPADVSRQEPLVAMGEKNHKIGKYMLTPARCRSIKTACSIVVPSEAVLAIAAAAHMRGQHLKQIHKSLPNRGNPVRN